MTAPKALTRKVGPAPLWAWLVVALVGAYIVVRHRNASPAQATAVPVTADTAGYASGATGSTASPDSGGASDLLSALTGNTDALAALQSALGGGGYGQAGGGGGATGSGSSTAAVTAPTVNSGTNNAPTDPGAPASPTLVSDVPVPAGNVDPNTGQVLVNVSSSGLVSNALTGAPILEHAPGTTEVLTDNSDAVSRYLGNTVAGPTPTTVTPAPVDTASTVTPGSRATIPKATPV